MTGPDSDKLMGSGLPRFVEPDVYAGTDDFRAVVVDKYTAAVSLLDTVAGVACVVNFVDYWS